MQGTTYEVHALDDSGEPLALQVSFSVPPGEAAEVAQSIARDMARELAASTGEPMGVFMKSFERITTVMP